MHELRGLPLWGQLGHQDMDITCWPCLCLVFIFWGRSHCIPWEKTAGPWPLVYHFSLSIASTISEQNLCRQSNSDLAFFAWVSWTWAFWSSGSLLVISFTSTTLLGSFCQRRSGPFNQFEATRCSAVRPAVDWWNFFRSHIPPLCWLCALLDPFYSVRFKHMKSSGFIFMYQSTTFESVEKNPCGQPTSSSFLRMSLLLSVSSRIKVVSLSVSSREYTRTLPPGSLDSNTVMLEDIWVSSIFCMTTGCSFMWCRSIFPSLDLSLSIAPSAFVDILLSWVQLS